MTNVEKVHSQRIGSRSTPVTFSEDQLGCYVWTRTGRITTKNEIEQAYFSCSRCRSKKQKDENFQAGVITSLKFNISEDKWIGDPGSYSHICKAKSLNEVRGLNIRRSVQAELATVTKETSAAARVRIDGRLLQEFPNVSEAGIDFHKRFCRFLNGLLQTPLRSDMRQWAAQSQWKELFIGPKRKHPNINTFEEFMGVENRVMRLTLRATGAKDGQANFGEQLLLYGGEDMLIFSSIRQLNLLNNCTHVICDGIFKYAPRGTKQIYRVFGLIRGTHATPLVTTLLKKKSKKIYKKMWQKIKQAVSDLAAVNSISFANFGAEVAAYSSFEEVFAGVSVKLCCFHVKRGIYRKVQGLGLSVEYQVNGQLQTVVRMLGALQITPIVEWAPCIQLLRTRISEANLTQCIKEKLDELLIYFENTWLSLGRIFCLFAYSGPRTTNHAESYHSKQRFHFSINSKLGHWVMVFKQLTHTEEMDAVNVFEGRQPPRRQRTDYAEITQSLAEEKDKLLRFLSSDDGMFRGKPYAQKLFKYLKRVGRLMGINALDYREILAQDEVIANQTPEEAPVRLQEVVVAEENPANINLFD